MMCWNPGRRRIVSPKEGGGKMNFHETQKRKKNEIKGGRIIPVPTHVRRMAQFVPEFLISKFRWAAKISGTLPSS